MTRVHIRWMIRRDMPDAAAIDADSPDPWTEPDFHRRLRQRNCLGMVAEYGPWVVGFMVYELHPTSITLLNLTVDPGYRREGIGRQLHDKLAGKLSPGRRVSIDAVVRDDRLDAHLWLRACGYVASGVARGHFGDADGYRFAWRLPPAPAVDPQTEMHRWTC